MTPNAPLPADPADPSDPVDPAKPWPLHALVRLTRRLRGAALLLLAAIATLAGPGSGDALARSGPPAGRALAPRGPLLAEEQANIDVFRKIAPSVVHITTLAARRDFFSLNVQQVPRGTGTGFVWDAQGHIVTNFHVIQGGSGARVTLADQSSYDAQLVGAFPDRDLAVLRIDAPADKLPPIPIGSSQELQVGQKVYAIGNPFGLDQTLTTGIVSALGREIDSFNNRTIRGVVQTDAAINPGNSGGPLLDSSGRLIGVNTQIASPSGASAGIGFAIPVDEVNRIVPRLIRDGRVRRPSLGLTAAPAGFTRQLHLPDGVAIVGLVDGGPAAGAGLQPFRRGRDGGILLGDIVTAVDGEPVRDLDDVLNLLEQHDLGDSVTLSVWRSGKTRELKIKLGETE